MTTPSVSYGVEIAFLTSGNFNALNGALQSAQQFGRTMKDAKHSLSGLGSHFASSFGSAVDNVSSMIVDSTITAAKYAGTAAAAALGYAVKSGLGANADFEGSINSIASTLHMLGDVPLDQGVRQATESTEHLRQLAAKLPGTFADARNAFASIVPVGVTHGIEMKRLEKLAAESVAVGASLGVDQRTAGHETASILEGRARASMPLFARLGLGSATDFNKLSAEKRFAKVEERFGKMGESLSLFENSWHGMTSTMGDNLTNVARHFTMPLFDSMKGSLRRFLDYYSANEDRFLSTAITWGQYLRHGWERGTEIALKWGPILFSAGKRFGDALVDGFERIKPMLDRGAALVERFAKDEHAPSKVGTAAMVLGGARLGVGAANMLGPALGAELGPALLYLAPLAIAAGGALHAYADEQSYAHDSVVRGVEDIRSRIGPTWDHLTAAMTRLEGPALLVADRMGTVLVQSLEGSALVIEKGTWLFDKWTGALEKAYGAIKPFLDRVYGPTLNRDSDVIDPMRPAFEYQPQPKLFDSAGLEALAKNTKPPVHTTHIHNPRVEVRVDGSEDPHRVATKTADIVMKMMISAGKNASQNANAGLYR